MDMRLVKRIVGFCLITIPLYHLMFIGELPLFIVGLSLGLGTSILYHSHKEY